MTYKAPRELKLKNILKKISVVRDGLSEGHMIKFLLINFVGLDWKIFSLKELAALGPYVTTLSRIFSHPVHHTQSSSKYLFSTLISYGFSSFCFLGFYFFLAESLPTRWVTLCHSTYVHRSLQPVF